MIRTHGRDSKKWSKGVEEDYTSMSRVNFEVGTVYAIPIGFFGFFFLIHIQYNNRWHRGRNTIKRYEVMNQSKLSQDVSFHYWERNSV